ncbi:MAG: restriction endonuclease subunit S [Phycisphaerae bacterium]|nr:restriction endonuclease subunit S [Phycisphaerae bacterium]
MSNNTVHLEQIADVFPGHYEQGSGKDEHAGTHRLVFIGSIDPGPGHRLVPEKCPRFTPKLEPGDAILQSGDLIMPARGDRQDVAYLDAPPDARPLVAASFLHVIRPHRDALDPGYLAWWLNQPSVQARVAAFVRGSNMPFLPLEETRGIKVTLPSLGVQRRIAELYRLSIQEFDLTTAIREHRQRLIHALAFQAVQGAIRT